MHDSHSSGTAKRVCLGVSGSLRGSVLVGRYLEWMDHSCRCRHELSNVVQETSKEERESQKPADRAG